MRVGPYELEGEIGRGGAGVVYRARSSDGRAVALKVVLRMDAAARVRFDRERRLLAELGAADGFVPILDAGETPHGPWLVMPLLEGGTLRNRLARGALPVEEALAIGAALAGAVGRAHARGIVHRDLKPENVLFTADGRPLVADLGLAKHLEDAATSQSVAVTRQGTFHGTAGYAPPEQIHDARAVDARADVFALGAIVYECFAGLPAFRAGSMLELLARVETAEHEPLGRARPDAPRAVIAAVERALARDPGRRFADAGELARALSVKAPAPARRRVLPLVAVFAVAAAATLALVGDRPAPPRAASVEPPPREAPAPVATRVSRAEQSLRSVEMIPAAVVSTNDPSRDRAEVLARAAGQKVLEGEHDAAAALAEESLGLDARCARAWAHRAEALAARGDHAGARRDGRRAVELDPSLAWAWANLGVEHAGFGDDDAALAAYERALSADPRLAFAWSNRAALRARRKDYRGAIQDYGKALELVPAPRFYCDRANAREQAGDLDGAREDYDRAIRLDRTDPAGYLGRGELRLRSKDFERGAADLRRFLELAPGDPRAPKVRDALAILEKASGSGRR